METALIAALVVVSQYAGILGQIGSAISGVDNGINATLDMHKKVELLLPKKPPAKTVYVVSHKKKVAKQ